MSNKGSDNNVGSIEKISQTSDKNVANIEDDVKQIKESIEEAYRCYEYDLDYNPFSKGIAEMIEHILAEREQKDKRIQELEEERNHWHGCFIVAMENSIAKEKVIDTINENGFEVYTKEYGNIEVVSIDVLQELLEGEK